MTLRGAFIGLILGLLAVAVHGAIEGFQDGFAVDEAPWAGAFTLEAAGASVQMHLLHPSVWTGIFLLASTLIGASAAPLLRSHHSSGQTEPVRRSPPHVRPAPILPPGASLSDRVQSPRG